MRNWPIPLITLYKLHASNPDDAADYSRGIRYEVVDGQNRLRALRAFMTGTPIRNDKGKDEPVTWEGPTGLAHGAGLLLAALPEEQQEWFTTYEIAVTVIQHPMSLKDRKAMFTRLQDGTKISSAEYAKNTEHPVSQFISRTGLRDRVLGDTGLVGYLAAAKSQWMDMLVDCVTLWIHRESENALLKLIRDQSALRKVLEGKTTATAGTAYDMSFSPADDASCLSVFDTLFACLTEAHAEKVKYHKFHVTILFHHLCLGGTPPTPTALRAWFKETVSTIKKDHDAGVTPEAIREGLLLSLATAIRIDDAPVVAEVPASPKRRAIPKKKRDALWVRHFGGVGTGYCLCCEAPILFSGAGWDQAHIVAVAAGGSNDIENLVPTCPSCNRSCGTEDLRTWCAREYPRAPFLRTVTSTSTSTTTTTKE